MSDVTKTASSATDISSARSGIRRGETMRYAFTGVFLSLLISAALTLHVMHFSHRNDGERGVWHGLPLWSTLERWEYSLLDLRFNTRGKVVPRSRDEISI